MFQSKPLRQLSNLPDRFTRTPTATHTIVYSLPTARGTGSLRYSNSIEPLGELEIIRIELVGTWNVRSMNQGKLEVVKQEMAKVNVDILGISEPKWTGMGEFNSDDHYIYCCGQEFLRRNGVAIMVNKRV